MQKFILFFSVAFVLTSCELAAKSKSQNNNSDTSRLVDEEITPDIKKLRQEYVLSYDKPIEFESFNKGKGNEKLNVWGKYYCLFDSAIVVPGKYNLDDTTKSFTTHNFAEDIVIISNGDTIIKKTITKNDFTANLPQYLRDYGIIFSPKFDGYDDGADVFDFDFSVSIPLTDVGQPMLLSLKRDGQITIKEAQ